MLRGHVAERHAHVEFEAALVDGGGNVPADLDVLLLAGTIRSMPSVVGSNGCGESEPAVVSAMYQWPA